VVCVVDLRKKYKICLDLTYFINFAKFGEFDALRLLEKSLRTLHSASVRGDLKVIIQLYSSIT